MKTFFITIKVEDPYPKEFTYRPKAGQIQVAIKRALDEFREKEWKGRPLKKINLQAVLL